MDLMVNINNVLQERGPALHGNGNLYMQDCVCICVSNPCMLAQLAKIEEERR